MAKKSFLEVATVSKREDNGGEVVKNVSFTLPRFQQTAIAGETGSGKSTLLKIISGLAQPDAGTVHFEGERVLGPFEKLIPGHPGIVYLSQHFELPGFLSVGQVLEYANELKTKDATLLYEVCRISHLMERRTDQLSGGEKQRIALARLLSTSPRLLLLDEPFSNLDMIHKSVLKTVIHDIGAKLKITTLIVSHDPLDTLSWADQVMVIKAGQIVQQGTPHEIYTTPVNEYVAGLFGRYNLLPAAPPFTKKWFPHQKSETQQLFIRPEQLELTRRAANAIPGKVQAVYYMGSFQDVEVVTGENVVTVRTPETTVNEEDTVHIAAKQPEAWML